MDTGYSMGSQIYYQQIKKEWECAEESREIPNRAIRVEVRRGWEFYIDEANVLVTNGALEFEDAKEVIMQLTGWSEGEVIMKMTEVRRTQRRLEFVPNFGER